MNSSKKENLKILVKYDLLVLFFALAAALLALGTKFINSRLAGGLQIPYCFCHDFLRLYCPLCGCTRAGVALFRLELLESLKANPFVVIFCLAFTAYNLASCRRILGGKAPCDLKRWSTVFGIALLIFALVRNVLMIFFGIDTLGELAALWR